MVTKHRLLYAERIEKGGEIILQQRLQRRSLALQ